MLVYLLFLLVLALILQHFTLRHVLDKVSYECHPSRSTLNPGEEFQVVSTIVNGKRMPVSYLRVQESLPLEIEPHSDVAVRRDTEQAHLVTTTFMKPRQRLVRSFPASIERRGRYFLRGAVLTGGDFLGLRTVSSYYPGSREIVVLPKPLEGTRIGETVGDYLGERSVNRFIMEDPVLTLGFREYTGREPLRAISWTQSARMGNVMVKNYDHTLDICVTVILNVQFPGPAVSGETIERCFSCCRTVCEILEKRKVKYALSTNATSAGAIGLWSSVGDGLGQKHLMTILEGLGRATYSCTGSFVSLLEKATRRDEAGRSYILITPAMTPMWDAALSRLRALKGADTLVLDLSRPAEEGSEEKEA